MLVSLIWAQAHGGVIGADGGIPWRLPEDMAQFRERTIGATVLMGRRTWESLPARFRPLPARRNIVLSGQQGYDAPGAEVMPSLDIALGAAAGEEVWVIGGGAVYAGAMPLADRLVVTEIDLDVTGDVYAPQIGPAWKADAPDWQVSSTGLRYRIQEFRRT